MSERAALMESFLAAHGWSGEHRSVLAEDASFRRYERLVNDWRRAVLMDAPPDHEDVRPFVAMANRLRAHGFSAPEVLEADIENGFLLLEDLGDDTFTAMLRQGADEATLYAQATEFLIQLHRHEVADGANSDPEGHLAPYGADQAVEHARLFLDWYFPAATGATISQEGSDAFDAAWRACLPIAYRTRQGVTLYDFMVDNLMWLPDRDGVGCVGLLDFQDAVWAPVTYDLASLLEDARRDVSPEVAAAMKQRFLDAFPTLDRTDFDASYAIMAAQRSTRILGVFTRLWRRDGKAGYLQHIDRVWRWLEGDLAHPSLAPVRAWFDAWRPPETRTRPDR